MGKEPVFVLGVGMCPFGKYPQFTLKKLAISSAVRAFQDAKINPTEIQAVFCSNAYGGLLANQESIRGETWTYALGLSTIPIFNIENACASGSTALHLAITSIRSGTYETVMVIGAEKMFVNDTVRTLQALESSADHEMMTGLGLQFSALDAIRVKRFMKEEELVEEDLIDLTVKSHQNSSLNEYAHHQKVFSHEDVANSRVIASPIRLLMCSSISDGAAAIIISRKKPPFESSVKFLATATSTARHYEGDNLNPSTAEVTAKMAYEEASVAPLEIDVVEVHDAVTPLELMYYRELGFCKPGQVASYFRSGISKLGGPRPVNPSGGLTSRGHPVGATGVAQIIELVWQLQGRAGKRQVKNARIALAQNAGGWMGHGPAVCTCHILGRED